MTVKVGVWINGQLVKEVEYNDDLELSYIMEDVKESYPEAEQITITF